MFGKQKGLYTIVGVFALGLFLGLALGSFANALTNQGVTPDSNAAEGAEILTKESAEGPGGYRELDGEIYQGYLSVYDDHLAIFDGLPPNGTLEHIMTDYGVRDDVRPQLEEGIPFTDTYDLLRLLENYTS